MEPEEQLKEYPAELYKHKYKVSSRGKILSNRKKDYLNTIISNGFEIFFINKPGSRNSEQFRIDIITATTFLPRSEHTFLEHIDGNKLNSDISNLRWTSIPNYLRNKYGYVWKPIQDYGEYYISTSGQVWSSFQEELIKQQIVSGYNSVNIGYPKQLFKHIHRLVAMSFIENQLNLPVVNHIDGNKFNNNIENLEWMTVSQNNQHALNNLSRKKPVLNTKCECPEKYVELDWLPNYYITENGNVYSTASNRYLKLCINDNGYYRVYCNRNFLYVHRLVAEAYLLPLLAKQIIVNHKNMNKLDNNVDNLEWTTVSQNNQHSKDNNPEQYKHLQKKVARLGKDTEEVIDVFNGIKEASRITNINSGSIVKVCKNIRPTAGGYKWKYIV